MIFNDPLFLFLFLPIVIFLFFVCARGRLFVLLVSSLVFYGISGLEHLIVLITGILWTWLITRSEVFVGNRVRLTWAVMGPLLALGYYKYAGFVFDDIFGIQDSGIAPETFSLFRDIMLPAGISFFTFQMISFSIDRYRGEILEMPTLQRFALYVSFFPQLVAGPILRFHEVAPRLMTLATYRPRHEDLSAGICYVVFGLAAKVLLADNLNYYIAPLIQGDINLAASDAVYVILAYSFQIYFDFYGYSLIAIGLGRILGFRFPDNFLRPYESLNIRDFWRRWHRTLSYWLRDYLYLPLGGNLRYRRNILFVFAITGLWHGAGLTFVVWGAYHGCLVLAYHAIASKWDRMPRLLQAGATFVLVSLGWSLFLLDFSGVGSLLSSLVGLGTEPVQAHVSHWTVLAVSAAVCFFVHFESISDRSTGSATISCLFTAGLAGLTVLTLIFLDRSTTFIYFRF